MAKIILNQSINPEKINKLNRFILQDELLTKFAEVGKLNLSLIQKTSYSEFTFADTQQSPNSTLKVIGKISESSLNPKNGQLFSRKVIYGGYDESKLQFLTLEGTANITSHSIVQVANQEFFPIGYITLYFYSRSNQIVNNSPYITYSRNPEADSNRDYAVDRNILINDHTLENSILFIDGPIIGGNLSSYSIKLVKQLHEKNIIPIFFVKNSNSNMVIDSIDLIKDKYNSDMHWSYNFLKQGERTNFFNYTDQINIENSKIFCYIKPFDYTSPQRIELHPDTFALYGDYIEEIFDLIYYLMLVQGNKSNPQIRPIAIAETYAREIIKTINTNALLKNTSLIPTIDQERFGG